MSRGRKQQASKRNRGRAPGAGGSRTGAAAVRPVPARVAPHAAWRVELGHVVARVRKLRERERELVAEGISAGASWSDVARILGISRQAAWQRFVLTIDSDGRPVKGRSAAQSERRVSGP